MQLRKNDFCPVYGASCNLPQNQLPTTGDAMRFCNHLRLSSRINSPFHETAVEVRIIILFH